MTRYRILAATVAATAMLAGCGGGGGGNGQTGLPTNGTGDQAMPTPGGPPTVTLGAPITGTIDSATDVDSFKLPVAEEGTLTIATTGNANPNIRVLDATGTEIPGRSGSYIIEITPAILAKGDHVIIQFFGGVVGQSYTATTLFKITIIVEPVEPTEPQVDRLTMGQLYKSGTVLPAHHVVEVTQSYGSDQIPAHSARNIAVAVRSGEEAARTFKIQWVRRGDSDMGYPRLTKESESSCYFRNCTTILTWSGTPHWFVGPAPKGHYLANLNSRTSQESEFLDASNPDYYGVWKYWNHWNFNPNANGDHAGFAIVGNGTSDLERFEGTTATYSGRAQLEFRAEIISTVVAECEGFGCGSNDHFPSLVPDYGRADIDGTATLTANFASGTISGQLDGWEIDDTNYSNPMPGNMVITIPETAFAEDGFSGAIQVSGTNSENMSGQFSGGFYGPEAQNVVGVMGGTYVASNPVAMENATRVNPNTMFTGWFATDKE